MSTGTDDVAPALDEVDDAPVRADTVPVGPTPNRGRRTGTGVPLHVVDPDTDEQLLPHHDAAVTEMAAEATAANTRRVYDTAVRRYRDWGVEHGYRVLPAAPRVVAAYFTDAAKELTPNGEYRYATATLDTWVAAIRDYHQANGFVDPARELVVGKVLKTARKNRTKAGRKPAKAVALLPADVRTIIDTIAHPEGVDVLDWSEQVAVLRDTMVVLVLLFSAARRSELAGVQVRDITVAGDDDERRVRIALRGTKTDATSISEVWLRPGTAEPSSCPCCILWDWLALLEAHDSAVRDAGPRSAPPAALRAAGKAAVIGWVNATDRDPMQHRCLGIWPTPPTRRAPVVRALDHGHIPHRLTPVDEGTITRIVKRRAAAAGFDPERLAVTSAHSLRAGFVTAARAAGASDAEIMRQTRHTRRETLDGYDHAEKWRDNATTRLDV